MEFCLKRIILALLVSLSAAAHAAPTCFVHRYEDDALVSGEIARLTQDSNRSELATYTASLPSVIATHPRAVRALQLWYLKTGMQFNFAQSAVPSAVELRGLVALAWLLPAKFRNGGLLQQIRRLPDGQVIDRVGSAVQVGDHHFKYQRIQGHESFSGRIEYAPTAHQIRDGRLDGSTFETIVHEMAHAFDIRVGLDLYGMQNNGGLWNQLFSESDRWSGVYQASASNAYEAQADEDFAESWSQFILNPDEMKSRDPAKYGFIADFFFKGARNDREALIQRYRSVLLGVPAAERAAKVADLRANDYYACRILTDEFVRNLR